MSERETAFLCDNCGHGFTERPVELARHSSDGKVVTQWWCWVCFYGNDGARMRKNLAAAGLTVEEFLENCSAPARNEKWRKR